MQNGISLFNYKFLVSSCPLFLLIKMQPGGQNLGNIKQSCESLNHLCAHVIYLAFNILCEAKNYIREFKQKLPGSPIIRLF